MQSNSATKKKGQKHTSTLSKNQKSGVDSATDVDDDVNEAPVKSRGPGRPKNVSHTKIVFSNHFTRYLASRFTNYFA